MKFVLSEPDFGRALNVVMALRQARGFPVSPPQQSEELPDVGSQHFGFLESDTHRQNAGFA